MNLQEILAAIRPINQQAAQEAKRRWDSIAKPLNSLGLLEQAVIRIAAMTGSSQVRLDRRGLVVMCADNGVVAEGVTQTGQEVTALVTENFYKGETSAAIMAKMANCDLIPVDIGVAREVAGEGLIHHKIAYGTGNIAQGPAMTRTQAVEAVEFGANLAYELAGQGYRILCTGEMGIGNTTTASAVTSVLLNLDPAQVTGRGAGLSSEGLSRKVQAIRRALKVNQPRSDDPLDLVAKVGGYDLAGLCGVFLGGALAGIPVVVDGFISGAAALLAVRLCPLVKGYLLASHCSAEPAGRYVLEALELEPVITAKMCLGEGTGAVALLPLLDLALGVYDGMSTFQEISMESYQPLD